MANAPISANSGLLSNNPYERAKQNFDLRNLEQFGNTGGGINRARLNKNGGFDIEALLQSMISQSGAANQANIDRRDMINNTFDQRQANAQNAFAGLGASETRRINEDATKAQAEGQQNLTSRGLSGTTMLSGNNNAVNRDKNNSLMDLNQNVAQAQFGVTDNIMNQQQGFNERITESGLNLAQILPLLMQFGQQNGSSGI